MNKSLVLHQFRARICFLAFDLFALALSWSVTVYLRHFLNPFFHLQLSVQDVLSSAPPVTGVLALWIIAALRIRGSDNSPYASLGSNILKVGRMALLANVLTIVVTFFSREFGAEISRSFVLLFLPVSFVLMICGRYAALLTLAAVNRRLPSLERVAVIGHGSAARQMVQTIMSTGSAGVKLTGVILPESGGIASLGPVPILGTTSCLAEVINHAQLNRLVVAQGHLEETELESCAKVSRRMGVILNQALTVPDRDVDLHLNNLYGLQLLELRPVEFTRFQELIKRTFDVIASAALLVLLSPLLLAVAAIIRLTSEGPALYRSTRVGRGGRHFTFLKFRSMYIDAADRAALAAKNEKSGHLFKIRNDPRVTPFGRFLRRWSIDELPQLINVLRGDMSMVGPRPLPAEDLDPDGQSREFAMWAEQRSRVLPGITGLWQIRGRSELDFENMVELDIEYIRNWSITLDFRILLETPFVLISGRGAY
ncbi:MAG: sugar transferase [Bryobacteraceae bacterium]|nr:sugar transferase [Bryobacteraceae bacterium]